MATAQLLSNVCQLLRRAGLGAQGTTALRCGRGVRAGRVGGGDNGGALLLLLILAQASEHVANELHRSCALLVEPRPSLEVLRGVLAWKCYGGQLGFCPPILALAMRVSSDLRGLLKVGPPPI